MGNGDPRLTSPHPLATPPLFAYPPTHYLCVPSFKHGPDLVCHSVDSEGAFSVWIRDCHMAHEWYTFLWLLFLWYRSYLKESVDVRVLLLFGRERKVPRGFR
jgi:hypothetical protein